MPQSDQPQFDSATEEATVKPIPPRFWWLKRIGVAVGVLLVALFALRLWWGWEANRRLQAEIDRIIAAGEPIYPEDFDPKEDIPDDQNAAKLLLQAAAAINLTTDQMKLVEEFHVDSAAVREHSDEVRAILEGNAQVFDILRRARGMSSAEWGVSSHTPFATFNAILPVLSGQRQLAKLLDLAAVHLHLAGDDGDAVGKLRDLLAMSDALAGQGTVIAFLAGTACAGLCSNAIEETAATLALRAEGADTAQSMHVAGRSELQAIIADLLDKPTPKAPLKNAMLWERMYQLDMVQQVVQARMTVSAWLGLGPAAAAASVWDATWSYLSAPLMQLEANYMLRRSSLLATAAEKPSWAEFKAALPEETTGGAALDALIHPFSRITYPSLDRTLVNHFRSLARRRMAAVALAIRLYQVDHDRRPATLSELVPDYLASVPEDPFSPNRSPIGYAPGARRAIVYSVGLDGIDDGGAYEFARGGIEPYRLDMPFFLDGYRPTKLEDVSAAPPPSTQAGDDQKDVEEDTGDADEEREGEEEP
jgi:hypothetical protein